MIRPGSRRSERAEHSEPDTAARPNRVTIYEVAKRAGVSIATVSHVLNRPERVSPATRQKVLEAVDHFDFVPKATAVSRARQGVGRIGVLAPFSAYLSYQTRLLGILDALAATAVEVAVFDCRALVGQPSALLASMPVTGRLDGLIVMGRDIDDEFVERTERRHLPTVLIDAVHPGLDRVLVDDDEGGRLIAEHLLQRQATDIAYIHDSPGLVAAETSGERRVRGFVTAYQQAGVENARMRPVSAQSSLAGGRDAAAQLLAWEQPPGAIVANHDLLAAGVWQGLTGAGWRFPEDARLIGYDGSDLADALGITTVRQPFRRTGVEAAALLTSRMDGHRGPAREVLLSPEFVLGTTS